MKGEKCLSAKSESVKHENITRRLFNPTGGGQRWIVLHNKAEVIDSSLTLSEEEKSQVKLQTCKLPWKKTQK